MRHLSGQRMTAPPPLIRADHMAVAYGDKRAVHDVSLEISRGEIVTLIGPNGAGKSSIVRGLIGLVPIAEGTIHRSPDLRIGYVPQKLAIDPIMPLSVDRFLRTGQRSTAAERAAVLDEVGAAGLAHSMMHQLSGGEFRRVLLARALLQDPTLLILDEPVQGVDAPGQIELYDLIADTAERRKCGVLIVSHDLHLVMARTHRVICVHGHVCCAGSPESVAQDPAYIKLFGPHGAQSLAVYTHSHDHHHH